MRRFLPIAAAIVLAVGAAPARAQDPAPADEVVADHWFVCVHGSTGKKTGWSHQKRVHATRDGVRVWITEDESVLDRGPTGETLAKPMRFSMRFVEDEAGRVVSYASSADLGMASGAQTREGRVEGDEIAVNADGKASRVAYPAGAVGPAAVGRAIAQSLKPGGTGEIVVFQALDPATSGTTKWKVPETTELVDVLGRRMWLFRVEKDDGSGIPDLTFPDGAGGEWAGAVNAGLQGWYRTEEAVAKADADPVDLLMRRIVATKAPVVADRTTDRLVLRLSRTGAAVGDLPEDRMQTVVARGKDGSVDLEIRSGEPADGTAILPRPYAGKADHAAQLAASSLVEVGNQRVKQYAEGAIGGLVNAVKCARAIELFVKMNVEPGPANVGFATAAQTISAGAGDWTESAVLSVGLARASGLPSRLVAGFVYWPASDWPEGAYPNGAFAPHTWAEILVAEDVWFPVDPMRMDGTQPQRQIEELIGHGGFDVTHVAVLRHDLDTTTPYRDILEPLLRFMDGLSVEVAPSPASDGK